jgi:hypothetical protein
MNSFVGPRSRTAEISGREDRGGRRKDLQLDHINLHFIIL